MSEFLKQITYTLAGASLMLSLTGLIVALVMPVIDQWSRRFFILYFIILVVYSIFATADTFLYGRPGLNSHMLIINYFETLLSLIMLPLITAFLLHCCGENYRHSRLFYTVTSILTVCFICLNLTPFTNWIYYISPENEFCRGPLYEAVVLVIDLILFLNVVGVIRRRSKLSKRYYYGFLIALIPMAVVVFIHLFKSVFILFGVSITLCTFSMFFMVLSDQIEVSLRQQEEISHQRASIIILQMRPHFIYNTMMSIYYLCRQDPELAQQVTLDFTTYLRKNFSAIASEHLIPFSEELEHTRAYLAVEQAQFDDSLFVDFDTTETNFRLPPLTLQPIVENAVKHGMDPDAGPLRIFIRTGRTASGHEIIVENNGTDFKSADDFKPADDFKLADDFKPADDSEPHIALKNIQQRLEMMCGGKMVITSRKEGGTKVTLTIPWRTQ